MLFDISATVPLLYFELYHQLGLSRESIFGTNATVLAILFASWASLWRRFAAYVDLPREGATPQPGPRGDDVDGAAESAGAMTGASTATDAAGSAGDMPITRARPQDESARVNGAVVTNGAPAHEAAHTSPRAPSPLDAIISMLLPPTVPTVADDATSMQLVSSPQFVYGILWFATHQIRANLYMGDVRNMLAYMGDDDGLYMQWFSLLLLSAVLFIPLIAAAVDHLGVPRAMQATTVLAIGHTLLALTPVLQLQPLTFVVFALLRACIYSIMSIFVATVFGFARLGTVLGIWNASGAVVNLLIPPITALVLERLDGDWSLVLWGLLLLCGPQFLLVVGAVSGAGRSYRQMV